MKVCIEMSEKTSVKNIRQNTLTSLEETEDFTDYWFQDDGENYYLDYRKLPRQIP